VAFTFTPLTGNFTIDYILQCIVDDTGRPDKLEEMKRRIQRAVMKHHMKDFYKKDHFDSIYVFNESLTEQVIDLTLIDRFRGFSYVRKFQTVDVNGNPIAPTTEGGDFTERAPEVAFDGYGFDATNVMYRAGTNVKLRSSTPFIQVFIGYYTFPIIEPITSLDSWIAREFPNLIAATAKRRIFADIGKDDEAKMAVDEEKEELLTLQTNNIRLQVM
jgi:hypothetical protein